MLNYSHFKSVIKKIKGLKGDNYLAETIKIINTQVTADIIFIASINEEATKAETIHVFNRGLEQENFSYILKGTPFQLLDTQDSFLINKNTIDKYPDDHLLKEMNMNTYAGQRIYDSYNRLIGILVFLYEAPIEDHENILDILEVTALFLAGSLEKKLIEHNNMEQYEKIKDQLAITEKIFTHSSDGIIITDSNNTIIYTNPSLQKMSGYTKEELLGKNPSILNSGLMERSFYNNLWQEIKENGYWQGEITNRNKTNHTYTVYTAISTIPDNHGKPVNHIAIHRNISTVKKAREMIAYQASHDHLTGLFNRYEFNARLEAALENLQREKRKGSFLLLDIDNFKYINDIYGHIIGDEYIKKISKSLKNHLNNTALIARLGGDEFGLFFTDRKEEEVIIIAKKLMREFEKPVTFPNNYSISSSVSIGICHFPSDADNARTLYSQADQALYQAKYNGKNTYAFFNEDLKIKLDRSEKIKSKLKTAIENKKINAYFQPIIDMSDYKISHVEVLARWHDEELGQIFPDEFIPIAENNNLISALGVCVLKKALYYIEKINKNRQQPLKMAINRSAQEFMQDGHVFFNTINESDITHDLITIELTESLMVENPKLAREKLESLRQQGYSIAMDDFGTGHSSLSYLKQFPFDYLKIDKSFTMELAAGNDDYKLIKTIIDMARNFGLKTIAEGVETEDQCKILKSLGCDFMQGYYFSRPLSSDNLKLFLDASSINELCSI